MLDRNSWRLDHDNGDTECVDGDAALPLNSVNQSDDGYKTGYSGSVQNEFSADDNGLSHLQLPDISTPDNEFKLFPKREEGRECTDLLDYGWPEIGNFEDIDQMFRSSDSTFGQSDATAEATSWFSPLMSANDSRENGGKLKEKAENMSVTCNVHGESTFNDEYNNKYACSTLNYWLLDVNDSSNMGVLFCSNWFDSESEEQEESEPSKQENTIKDGNKTNLSPLLPVDNGNDMPRHHYKQKLDPRTKLCIRDSLYRLARSAEQRHNLRNGNHKSNSGVGIVEGSSAEESNKSDGVVVAETNTNPIDRSMVHLLFYRPPNALPSSTIGEMSRDAHSPINGTSMT